MSYFRTHIVDQCLTAGVAPTDSIKSALSKLEKCISCPNLPLIKNFIRNRWGTDRFFMDKTTPFGVDPALDQAVLVKTPFGKFVKFKDTMFQRCPRCGGRLFPEFDFCPFCSYNLGENPPEPQVLPETPAKKSILLQTGKTKIDGRSLKVLANPKSDKDVYFEDSDVRVTIQEFKDVRQKIKDFIPGAKP